MSWWLTLIGAKQRPVNPVIELESGILIPVRAVYTGRGDDGMHRWVVYLQHGTTAKTLHADHVARNNDLRLVFRRPTGRHRRADEPNV